MRISLRLIARLAPLFPGSRHVIHADLDNSPDSEFWRYARKRCCARENSLAIVSKDKDFLLMLERLGHPPKLTYPTVSNVKLAVVESLLTEHQHTTAS